VVSDAAPDFVKTVTAAMLAGLGDALPVSALPPDGTWPMGTTRWEKRNIAEEIPVWKEELCTQCNHCVAACPHSAIRAKVVPPQAMDAAPACTPWMSNRAICAGKICAAGGAGRLHRL
jgi:pyruvate-ferredoxin/flavodoxin oxidoreductase